MKNHFSAQPKADDDDDVERWATAGILEIQDYNQHSSFFNMVSSTPCYLSLSLSCSPNMKFLIHLLIFGNSLCYKFFRCFFFLLFLILIFFSSIIPSLPHILSSASRCSAISSYQSLDMESIGQNTELS